MKTIHPRQLVTLLIGSMLAICHTASADLTRGLVAHYAFDGSANDSTPNGNKGTLNGGSFTADYMGREDSACYFDGNSEMDVPDSASLQVGGTAITLAAWVYPTQFTGSANRRTILRKMDQAFSTGGYLFALSNEGFPQLGFIADTYYGVQCVTTVLPLFQWSHVAVTYDGQNARFYVDGVLKESIPETHAIAVDDKPLCLGRLSLTFPTEEFYGKLDDVRIYNRTLAVGEVAQLHDLLSAGFPHGKIVAHTGSYQLRVLDTIAGTEAFVPLPAELRPTDPDWSPDGQWIAFAAFPATNHSLTQIYVVHPDGSSLRQVSDGTKNVTYPAFSPDGNKIAFTGVEGDGDIYIVNFDGSGTTNLGVGIVHSQIKWSPDGKKLLYDNWGFTYASDLFVYDLTSGTKQKITSQQGSEAFFRGSWSPDRSKILCSHHPDSTTNWRVCVMNADGSNPVDLTADWASSIYDPAWSPDGRYIVFPSNQDGHYDLWAMWSDGGGRTNLTNGLGEDFSHLSMGFVAPRIDIQPQSRTAAVGDNSFFSVTVAGSTPLRYQWQFNGVDIAGATGSSLTLAGVAQSQAGSYCVVVTNSRGSVTSASAALSFLSLRTYAGLTLVGPVPMSYRIDTTDSLSQPNWTTLTTITVTNNPSVWVDLNSPNSQSRFYKAVPLP